MIGKGTLTAFLATSHPERCKVFYARTLGLRLVVTGLARRGVFFERYPFLEQDDHGVWLAPSGTSVAWFKDPDGNLLSLSESGAAGARSRRLEGLPTVLPRSQEHNT